MGDQSPPKSPESVLPAKAGTSAHSVLGSCLRRNDGVKALAFIALFRGAAPKEPLNKSVTGVFVPTRRAKAGTSVHSVSGSCLRRNDGVKPVAYSEYP